MSERITMTVGLTDEAISALDIAADESTKKALPKMVQNALQTYAALKAEVDEGGEFYLRSTSGEMRRVRFPFQVSADSTG